MSNANYIITSNGELRHGRVIGYIDLDEGELMHWKYIKKKKLPNGKWRYYYDVAQLKDDLGFDELDRMKKATTDLDTAIADREQYEEQQAAARANMSKAEQFISTLVTNENQAGRNDAQATKEAKQKAVKDAGREAIAATKAFQSTPIGKLDKLVSVVTGKNRMKDLLNKLKKLF